MEENKKNWPWPNKPHTVYENHFKWIMDLDVKYKWNVSENLQDVGPGKEFLALTAKVWFSESKNQLTGFQQNNSCSVKQFKKKKEKLLTGRIYLQTTYLIYDLYQNTELSKPNSKQTKAIKTGKKCKRIFH